MAGSVIKKKRDALDVVRKVLLFGGGEGRGVGVGWRRGGGMFFFFVFFFF